MIKKLFHSLIFLFTFFKSAIPAFAQGTPGIGISIPKQPGGIKLTGNDPVTIIGNVFQNIITLFFTVGAIGFIIMFIWGSVDWILSGGDKEKIAGARKRMVTAITGLVLLSLTFVIMTVIGQILGIESLFTGEFKIPSLVNP